MKYTTIDYIVLSWRPRTPMESGNVTCHATLADARHIAGAISARSGSPVIYERQTIFVDSERAAETLTMVAP